MRHHVVVIGAGPAGLTAAYELVKAHVPVTVFEADPIYVGGIAKTVTYNDYCFDIGGHRFFSKSKEIEDWWAEMLPNDMLERPRLSRIYYRGHFFAYPLKALDALRKLGLVESTRCVLSYLKARLFPIKHPANFSDWVINHFGERLFGIFFKTYTEKVWGMKCEEISADWAAQRIKGLSLSSAILAAIMPKRFAKQDKQEVIKTLIDTFRYPRKGPGMLWEACALKIKQQGGVIEQGYVVYRCDYNAADQYWTICASNEAGNIKKMIASHVISSAPLREMVLNALHPIVSPPALEAARKLQYRDFLIVVLILKDRQQFDDNWIYIHDPSVDVARIQNFKSWSPEMVPEAGMTCYGMEYFCFRDDTTWAASDEELMAKATQEIVQLGLADSEDIVDGCVVRQAKAYPVYDQAYQRHVEVIRRELAKKFPTLYLVGRNGMHKYNNQDHAMMTAMLAVKNLLAGKNHYDIWAVNQDAEYIEAGVSSSKRAMHGLRDVPERVS